MVYIYICIYQVAEGIDRFKDEELGTRVWVF